MPRPRLVDRPVDKKLSLRTSIVTEIDSQLADSLTGKPRYGAWTELVESLLNKWLSGEIPDIHIKPKIVDLGDMLCPKESETKKESEVEASGIPNT